MAGDTCISDNTGEKVQGVFVFHSACSIKPKLQQGMVEISMCSMTARCSVSEPDIQVKHGAPRTHNLLTCCRLHRLQDLFWRFHRLVTAPKQPAMQAGWLTFLLLKAELLPEFPDLVRCAVLCSECCQLCGAMLQGISS